MPSIHVPIASPRIASDSGIDSRGALPGALHVIKLQMCTVLSERGVQRILLRRVNMALDACVSPGICVRDHLYIYI
jgi:hypothetical protein